MPEVGERRRGKDIGGWYGESYRKYVKFTWVSCIGCYKERWLQLKKDQSCLYCPPCAVSRRESRIGNKNHNWKGGKYINQEGYVFQVIYPDNPYYSMKGKANYVLEHRLVMAQHLGKCLEKWELVHHKNGIKTDNRIENLELLPAPFKEHISSTAFQKEIIRLQGDILKWQKLTVWLLSNLKSQARVQ